MCWMHGPNKLGFLSFIGGLRFPLTHMTKPGNYMKKFNETEGTCSFYGTVHMRTQTVLARTIQVTDAKMMNGPCVCSLNVCVVAYSILAVVLRCLLLEFLPALIAFAYRHHGLL